MRRSIVHERSSRASIALVMIGSGPFALERRLLNAFVRKKF
jgi:hypothetical protein